MWTQNTRIIHDVWRLLILSNEEKTNDYENFEKGMIYMKILKKGGVVEKRGEEETKSMPHAPVPVTLFTRDADWHKLVTDLFYDFVSILLVWVAKYKMPSNWKISET